MYAVRYLHDMLQANYRSPGLKRLQCRHWVKKHCFRLVTCLYRHELIPSHIPLCSHVERGATCPRQLSHDCLFTHKSSSSPDVPTQPIASNTAALCSELEALTKELACNVNPFDRNGQRSTLESIIYTDEDIRDLESGRLSFNLAQMDYPARQVPTSQSASSSGTHY